MLARPEVDRRIPVEKWGRHFCLPRPGRNVPFTPRTACVGWALSLSWVVAAACFSGCGDKGPDRAIVSGTVTYKGEPISDGTILFTPMATSRAPSAGASIVDGNYKIDGHGGVPVGMHRINIEAYRNVSSTLRPGQPEPRNYSDGKVRQQYLPKTYNASSQLQITIEPGSREITKNFDLTD